MLARLLACLLARLPAFLLVYLVAVNGAFFLAGTSAHRPHPCWAVRPKKNTGNICCKPVSILDQMTVSNDCLKCTNSLNRVKEPSSLTVQPPNCTTIRICLPRTRPVRIEKFLRSRIIQIFAATPLILTPTRFKNVILSRKKDKGAGLENTVRNGYRQKLCMWFITSQARSKEHLAVAILAIFHAPVLDIQQKHR